MSLLDPTAQQGRREIKVKIPADHQPVPPAGLMAPAEFEGLQVIPYMDSNRAKPRVAIAYRATGFRAPARAQRQTSLIQYPVDVLVPSARLDPGPRAAHHEHTSHHTR